MIRSRWQGFNVESGENQAPLLLTHWYVLQQGLIFALFSIPLFSGLAVLLSRHLLRPDDRPVVLSDAASISGDFTHDRSQASQKPSKPPSD
jgi:hypothetical protein